MNGCHLSFLPDEALDELNKSGALPCHVYHEAGIRAAVAEVRQAFAFAPDVMIRFPVRMNPEPAVLRILREEGCGVECQNIQELRLAEQLGFSDEQLIFAPMLPEPEGDRLTRKLHGVRIIDGPQALPYEVPPRVLLRWRLRRMCRACELTDVMLRFGMERDSILGIVERLAMWTTAKLGVTIQLPEPGASPESFQKYTKELCELADQIESKTGVVVSGIDLGGGFSVGYRDAVPPYTVQACADQVRSALADRLGRTTLSVCAGRYLLANNGVTVVRAAAVKQSDPPLIIMDLPGTHLMHMQMPGTCHEVVPKEGKTGWPTIYCVTGSSSGAYERVLRKQMMPEVHPGDVLTICSTGADGASFSSSYGGARTITSWLYDSGGRLIRLDGNA